MIPVEMDGTYQIEQLRHLTGVSLFLASNLYRIRKDGSLQFRGQRPGPGWHAHGCYSCHHGVMNRGEFERPRLFKQRWFKPSAPASCHSEPPDDTPSATFCTLVICLKLWAWLDSSHGVRTCPEVWPSLSGVGCARTVQRWGRRAQSQAMEIQQAIREAVIERCEPRPVEFLFPSGLPPPERLMRRRWRDPAAVSTLWRALALLFGGAIGLDVPATLLLAEARGRMRSPTNPFPF